MNNMEAIKHFFDGLSFSISVAAVFAIIPHVAAVLSLVWAGLRVYGAILDNRIKKKELDK